jgi:hypothetical protein
MIFFVFKIENSQTQEKLFSMTKPPAPRKKKIVVFEFEEWPTQEKLLFFPIEDNQSPENCFRIEKDSTPENLFWN